MGFLTVLVLLGAISTVYLMVWEQKTTQINPTQLQEELASARADYQEELVPLMDHVGIEYEAYLDSTQAETQGLVEAIESLNSNLNSYRSSLKSFYELERDNQKFVALNREIIKAVENHYQSKKQLQDSLRTHEKQQDKVAELLTQIRVDVIQPTLNLARQRDSTEQVKFWSDYERSWREDLNQPFQAFMKAMVQWESGDRSSETLETVSSARLSLAKKLNSWKLNARLNQDLDALSAPLQKEIDALQIELVSVSTKVTLMEEDQLLVQNLSQQWAMQREQMTEDLAAFKITKENAESKQAAAPSKTLLIVISLSVTLILMAFLIVTVIVTMVTQSKYGVKGMGAGIFGTRGKRNDRHSELFSNENYVKKMVEERHREALNERQTLKQQPVELGGLLPDEMLTVVDAIEQLSASIREMSGTITEGQDQQLILPGASLATGSLSEIAGKAEYLARQASLKVESMTEVQSEIQLITDTMKQVAHNVSRLSVNVSIEVAASTKENPELSEIVKELKVLSEQTVHAVEQMALQISSLRYKSSESKEAIHELSEAVKVVSLSAGSLSKMMELTQHDQSEEQQRADARAVADELLESLQRIHVKDEAEKTSSN